MTSAVTARPYAKTPRVLLRQAFAANLEPGKMSEISDSINQQVGDGKRQAAVHSKARADARNGELMSWPMACLGSLGVALHHAVLVLVLVLWR